MEYLIAFLGFLIYLGLSMIKTKRSHKNEWQILVYLKDHAIELVTSLISVFVLMLMINEIMAYFSIPGSFKLIFAAFTGFANIALFKYIMDLINPKNKKERPKSLM